jgi:hypothetical protein
VSEPVDVILLTYNRLDYLQEMLDGLEQRTRWPYRLTIVDNASGARTRQWLRAHRDRFERIIWNPHNEHLAAHQHGIAATSSPLFVVSDADLVPMEPLASGCWLTLLVALAERHPDFGLIGARLDSVTEARNVHEQGAPVVDGEIIEGPTGVWLNLIRRSALRVPYMGDGITGYALRRAGYRVGIGAEVRCTHLGDQDPERHPEYLARKEGSTGLGTVYPSYPELRRSRRPPTLSELAAAAPVLAALRSHGIGPLDAVELSRERWPPVAAVDPRVQSAVRGPVGGAVARSGVAAAEWVYEGRPPLAPAGARAVVLVCGERVDRELLGEAMALAGELVVVLAGEEVPEPAPGWSLREERPGAHPAMLALARVGSRGRLRRALGYSTSEHREEWTGLFAAAGFGDHTPTRVYVLTREAPLARAAARWRVTEGTRRPAEPRWRAPVGRRGRVGAVVTKAQRVLRAEWYLRRR